MKDFPRPNSKHTKKIIKCMTMWLQRLVNYPVWFNSISGQTMENSDSLKQGAPIRFEVWGLILTE